MNKTAATRLTAGLALLVILSGCTSEPPPKPESTKAAPKETAKAAPAPAPAPAPTPAEDEQWWEDPDEVKLNDVLTIKGRLVDSDGSMEEGDHSSFNVGSDPSTPAPIAPDGNILLAFLVGGGEVSRYVTEAYVSTDPEGKSKGPALECSPPANAVPQEWECWAVFKDPKFETGTYYGVFVTEPAQSGFDQYGELKMITPIYTRLPN